MSLKRDVEFLYEVGCLRFIQRTWKQFYNPDFQNLAEHTLRVIWIATMIAKHEKNVDHAKVMKMALVHDLSESRAGDVHYVSRLYTERHEEEALEDTLAKTVLEEEYVVLWKEYEKRDCIEAKIVKDADNIDIDLELQEQEARGHRLKNKWIANRERAVYQNLFTQSAKKIWKELQAMDPHDWHTNSNNRFTKGDWKK